MPENDDYVPYGPEWEAELLKFSKKDLINIYKTTLLKLKKHEHGLNFAKIRDIAVDFHQAHLHTDINREANIRTFDNWFKPDNFAGPEYEGVTLMYNHDIRDGQVIERWDISMAGGPLPEPGQPGYDDYIKTINRG